MNISLDTFEQVIDKTILERGLDYFQSGYILNIEEVGDKKYHAIVEGTENYNIIIALDKKQIAGFSCDCPYDYGPVCKHIIAVLYHLQNKKLTKSKINSTVEQIHDIFANATHDDLKRFIREQIDRDASLRNNFVNTFTHYITDQSRERYDWQIKSILHSAADRSGFIDWRAADQVSDNVSDFLLSTRKQLEQHNYKSVFYMCTAVMEQMTMAIQFTDDSNGTIGVHIDDAFEILYNMVNDHTITNELRKEIIAYCLTAFEGPIYIGWDWRLDLLQLASLVIENDIEAEKVISCLDSLDSDFGLERSQLLKYEILLKIHGKHVAQPYLEKHITNDRLRKIAIKNALNDKNYTKAKELAKEGITYDQQERPGLVSNWYNWLLKIAQAERDKPKIIEYARYLLIDYSSRDQDYYKVLKKHVPKNEWKSFILKVVEDIPKYNKWFTNDLIAKIFIKEKWWDRLLEVVKKNPSLENIAQYEKYLAKHFCEEIIDLYAKAVKKYIKTNVSRNHYKIACRYLRRMKKLGAFETVNNIIAQCRKEYPRRRALIDELNNI